MNDHIFTDWERGILRRFLDTGEKLEGFAVVKSRILQMDLTDLEADLALMKTSLQHFSQGRKK